MNTEYDKELVRRYNVYPALVEALEQVERYFTACYIAWHANEGRVMDTTGRPVAEAEGLARLCDQAAQAVRAAIMQAKGVSHDSSEC